MEIFLKNHARWALFKITSFHYSVLSAENSFVWKVNQIFWRNNETSSQRNQFFIFSDRRRHCATSSETDSAHRWNVAHKQLGMWTLESVL